MRAFGHLTDGELLRQLEVARVHSPVIDELCKRLDGQSGVLRGEQECPVCLSRLDASFYFETEEITLEMKK